VNEGSTTDMGSAGGEGGQSDSHRRLGDVNRN